MEGDSEANYAYYALYKLKILPSVFDAMCEEEKAFVIASIQIRVENEKKEQRRLERESKRGR
ncbi:hypothetical protein [[Clostridium] polysaccharolyticum]|uniref:hypothetical protein n=1 Tax=[Clostridium] polysaccharolyticum TaxID=29364 RepID=UPI000B8596ED|nr:hypothetical protein [[Clostridium] polysaccharolyticum]